MARFSSAGPFPCTYSCQILNIFFFFFFLFFVFLFFVFCFFILFFFKFYFIFKGWGTRVLNLFLSFVEINCQNLIFLN